jgi:hypothetical protein
MQAVSAHLYDEIASFGALPLKHVTDVDPPQPMRENSV